MLSQFLCGFLAQHVVQFHEPAYAKTQPPAAQGHTGAENARLMYDEGKDGERMRTHPPNTRGTPSIWLITTLSVLSCRSQSWWNTAAVFESFVKEE